MSRVADLMFSAVHAIRLNRDGSRIGVVDTRRDCTVVAE
jgi:hypothetical protein